VAWLPACCGGAAVLVVAPAAPDCIDEPDIVVAPKSELEGAAGPK
jgi:hypothetical protein